MVIDCPCGSKKLFDHCCHPLLSGERKAATPEELMRSRYTAFTRADISYIMKTMSPPASDHFDKESALQWARSVTWQKLTVINSTFEGSIGKVEFIAEFILEKELQQLHEISSFKLINGKWFYVDGEHIVIKSEPKQLADAEH